MTTLGSFTLIKNEIRFIQAHLDCWLPVLDEMVFFDGNSTDGTLEVIKKAKKGLHGGKVKLFEGKDPVDLAKDYERLSNECMWALSTDMAMFLHPDMMLEKYDKLPLDGQVAAYINVKSLAGEPGGLYEIKGRGTLWKNVYRLRNPDFGAHYHGFYGAANEDTYFSEITGNDHTHYGTMIGNYPYIVAPSGIEVKHYSDVRPYARRLDRMTKCLINQGYPEDKAKEIAPTHPRVSLKDGAGFSFEKVPTPEWLK